MDGSLLGSIHFVVLVLTWCIVRVGSATLVGVKCARVLVANLFLVLACQISAVRLGWGRQLPQTSNLGGPILFLSLSGRLHS